MPSVPAALQLDNLCVVLVAPRNPLNIGAAARAMGNFGVRRLHLVNAYSVAFREARSAMGASGLLARAEEHASLAAAVAGCSLVVGTTVARKRELQHPLRSLPDAAPLIQRAMRSSPVALVFGSEKRGLSRQDLSHCHWLLRIPTEGDASMNLGQAVAVCLYQLTRRRAPARITKSEEKAAAAAELERITALLLECLHASGYIQPRAARSAEEKLRRLVRRLRIPAADADLWLGILRQISWKLQQKK
jgi:TrmH family RNA methyltransferase